MILRPPTSLSSVLMPSSLLLSNLYDYEIIKTIKAIHENEHNYIKTLYFTFSLPLLHANQSPDKQPQNQKLYLFNIVYGIKQALDFILSTVFPKIISTYFIWSYKISCTFQQNFWRDYKWYKKYQLTSTSLYISIPLNMKHKCSIKGNGVHCPIPYSYKFNVESHLFDFGRPTGSNSGP